MSAVRRGTVRVGRYHGVEDTQEHRILVTTRFEPDVVVAREGAPIRLVFRRGAGSAFRDAVVFPQLGRMVTLPYGVDVRVDFEALPAGRYDFYCPGETPRGTLIVHRARRVPASPDVRHSRARPHQSPMKSAITWAVSVMDGRYTRSSTSCPFSAPTSPAR
jgi:hypothetical protein